MFIKSSKQYFFMSLISHKPVHAKPGPLTANLCFRGVSPLSDGERKTLLAGVPDYPESKQLALAMWKLCPTIARGSAITALNIWGHKVVRTSNFVVVANEPNGPFPNLHNLVVYPRPEHIPVFVTALKSVRPGGYGESNPGSIGTIHTSLLWDAVYDIQAHYKTSDPYESDPLPRKYATMYSGWRIHAIEEFLRTGMQLGCQTFEFNSSLFTRSEKHSASLLQDIAGVLSRFGMSYTANFDVQPQ
jgi:hypothetical protein